MERIILVGTDPSIAELHRLMAREGVRVEVRGQLDGGIASNSGSVIMVDELLDQEESALLLGAGSLYPAPSGLIARFPQAICNGRTHIEERRPVLPIYGGPRPYLKRKKGRS